MLEKYLADYIQEFGDELGFKGSFMKGYGTIQIKQAIQDLVQNERELKEELNIEKRRCILYKEALESLLIQFSKLITLFDKMSNMNDSASLKVDCHKSNLNNLMRKD